MQECDGFPCQNVQADSWLSLDLKYIFFKSIHIFKRYLQHNVQRKLMDINLEHNSSNDTAIMP